MKVLLLHLDGKLPNLALMRIAAHHRALGDQVTLRHAPTPAAVAPELGDRFDRVYASAVFARTRPVAERLLQERPDAIIGGTGWDLTRTLEDVGITTKALDYDDYPRFRPSIGFTQRGCRLTCSFCVVPRKEGEAREEQSIADIWRGNDHPREILLLDNDFFGVPSWRLLFTGHQRPNDLAASCGGHCKRRLPGRQLQGEADLHGLGQPGR
jgi:hypothetical protein